MDRCFYGRVRPDCYVWNKKGYRKIFQIMMPFLFLMIVILMVRSVTLPGAGEGISFLIKPDFSR
jgi:NSS family neurotransmitter:Na+ symporter